VTPWPESRFTGPLLELGPVAPRAHDPDVCIHAGLVAPGRGMRPMETGGAALTADGARAATLGETIERLGGVPHPRDRREVSSFAAWREPALDPARLALFSAAQYAKPGFPFRPFTRDTECEWVAFRTLAGAPCWVPADLAYLGGCEALRGAPVAPRTSTGLAAGRASDAVVQRATEEVIERDAAAGGWWGAYPVREHDPERVFAALGPELARRFRRPNLAWRFYRVDTPFAAHATWVTCRGEDREGLVFSSGSACRGTRTESWTKSLVEAVQDRHWVRHLLATGRSPGAAPPVDFAAHAAWYSVNPDVLGGTVLSRAPHEERDVEEAAHDDLASYMRRLGEAHPVLVRAMSPEGIAHPAEGWRVVRVVVPGLRLLEGDHRLAHLGGPGAPHLTDPDGYPPHPFA
jgi:thiazole/oxazole-forming peptide maturase SagD family component